MVIVSVMVVLVSLFGFDHCPRFVVEAVALLADNTSDGQVHLGGLGQYLKRADPSFSPKDYGHSGLLDMLKTYDLLELHQAQGGRDTVRQRS